MNIMVNTANMLFNGKPIEKEDSDYMLEFLKYIKKQQEENETMDLVFNRGAIGWKGERTMKLGLNFQKLLYKLRANGIAPHITLDIPINEKKDTYESFYRGPDLEINEDRQSVKITGIAHLSKEQLKRFMQETDSVYCQVMDLKYDDLPGRR